MFDARMIQFIVAIGFGVGLGASEQGFGGTAASVVVGAFVMTAATVVLESRRLPPSMRKLYGVTLKRGVFSYLFVGTIITITITAVFVRLIGAFR